MVKSVDMRKAKSKVLIKGAGEVATGIAHALYKAGYEVVLTDIAAPLAVSRATSYSEAIFDGKKTIEEVTAEFVPATKRDLEKTWQKGNIAVIVDPEVQIEAQLCPDVVIDARMTKHKTYTKMTEALLVIGIGPGFIAGVDVHVVIESNDSRGNLGKSIYQGESEQDTGIPIKIGGLTSERVVWASQDGVFETKFKIGEAVESGQEIGMIGDVLIKSPLSGHIRAVIRDGTKVFKGTKLIEVDHIYSPETYNNIRPKMKIIGEAVVKAIKKAGVSEKN